MFMHDVLLHMLKRPLAVPAEPGKSFMYCSRADIQVYT